MNPPKISGSEFGDEPIRIFSDLHLGHPGCRIRSVDELTPLFEGAGTIIFNGDTVEQRHSLMAVDGERFLEVLKSRVAEVGARAVFLRGNHDPEISGLDHLDLADGRVFLTHGDALFRHLSPWSPKVWPVVPEMESIRAEYGEDRLADDLAACLECAHRCRQLSADGELEFRNTGPFAQLQSLARIAWPIRRPLRILKTWLTIPDLAHEFAARHRPDARVFLFGHTHLPGIWKRDGRVAINTGGFLSVMPAQFADIHGETLVVRRIVEDREGCAFGREVLRVAL